MRISQSDSFFWLGSCACTLTSSTVSSDFPWESVLTRQTCLRLRSSIKRLTSMRACKGCIMQEALVAPCHRMNTCTNACVTWVWCSMGMYASQESTWRAWCACRDERDKVEREAKEKEWAAQEAERSGEWYYKEVRRLFRHSMPK